MHRAEPTTPPVIAGRDEHRRRGTSPCNSSWQKYSGGAEGGGRAPESPTRRR